MQISYGRLKFKGYYLNGNWEFNDGNEIKKFSYHIHECVKCLNELSKDGWKLVWAFDSTEFILEKIQ